MENKRIKLNLFDYLIIISVISFFLLLFISWYSPTKALSGYATLGVHVTENADLIKESIKQGEKIYLNGSNNASEIESFEKTDDGIIVTIKASAEKDEEVYNFNGQRVLIGQKAELHGSFFARGVIESFNYED